MARGNRKGQRTRPHRSLPPLPLLYTGFASPADWCVVAMRDPRFVVEPGGDVVAVVFYGEGACFLEIARVLKPGGRLVIADFKRKQERAGRAARFHAGGSSIQDLAAMVWGAGFSEVETEEMQPPRFSAFPGAGLVRA